MKKRQKGGEKKIAEGRERKNRGKSKDYCIREREKDDRREAAR